jgi:formate dehydrogenase iron-sulfur subunit
MGAVGFFTDATVCIGCKACEAACKQWNQLPDDGPPFTGMSYDNTVALGAATWRHVAFVERNPAPSMPAPAHAVSWLLLSDVCKHCRRAGCLEACPTGAIVRTEFDSVYVQPDVCNGCGYCVVACPFGVIERRPEDGRAWKCTFCYDRLKGGMEPACAKTCPTGSILFGDPEELRQAARERLAALHARGMTEARLYGADAAEQPGTAGLNAFFLLRGRPEVYNLPPNPAVPTKTSPEGWAALALSGAGLLLAAVAARLAAGRRRGG